MHGRQFRMRDGIENENPVVKMRQCKIDGTFGLSDYDVFGKSRLHEIEGFKNILRAELLNKSVKRLKTKYIRMKIDEKNGITNPSKKQVVGFTVVWLIGLILLVLSMTDLFREALFQKKYTILYLLIFGSTVALFKVHTKYWKSRE